MFHFSRYYPEHILCTRYERFALVGFPIRKSSDQRLVTTSPRLIASTLRPSSSSGPEASTICQYSIRAHDYVLDYDTDFNCLFLPYSIFKELLSNKILKQKTALKAIFPRFQNSQKNLTASFKICNFLFSHKFCFNFIKRKRFVKSCYCEV